MSPIAIEELDVISIAEVEQDLIAIAIEELDEITITIEEPSQIGGSTIDEVIQGTDHDYLLTFTDASGRVDLTGSTVYYRWKKNQADANPPEIAKLGILAAQVGATLGQAGVQLIPADTETLETGWHYWDVWVVLASGKRHARLPQRVHLADAVTDL